MAKLANYTKYITKKIVLDKQDVKIINGQYVIEPFIFEARRLSCDKPPPNQNNNNKPDKRKTKSKSKRMTEKRVKAIVKEEIDVAISKNNEYLLSEMDKRDQRLLSEMDKRDKILLSEIKAIVAPINEKLDKVSNKLDKVIKLNNLKTK